MAKLLLVPVAYASISMVLSIVSTILIGFLVFSYILAPMISIGITLAIVLLFVTNYRILKQTDPKGMAPTSQMPL